MTKREYKIFTQITLKQSYINILGFLQFIGLQRLETTIYNARKLFWSPKPSKHGKKRIRNIYANHPKTIVYQHFGFSSILRLAKARNHHFECHEVILQPKNHQNMTKREYEIFTQITLK